MSANLIPKEKQTAYQRWEMASFGDTRSNGQAAQNGTDVQLAALREQARLQGYAEGKEQGCAEGRQGGYAAGLEEGRNEAAREIACLQQLAENFRAELTQANEVIAQDMLNLALDLAKAMLKTALQVRPELVLPIVSEAVRYLPTLQQPAILYLHPMDAQIVQRAMEAELSKAGWRIAEDTHMERGGCRIETGSNQIDATTPVRWQRIAAALGQQSDWMPA
ncbi:flagellar assembly protein FliH [Oxalobacteraceae bacterium R-40]|uniref:Flagellar assembly protein FliH n=1 Tax=Keguizhuia sedimenti TaxID=3064264 RepID=A0ABU1BP94_9BURK|nr:flagellar assembly protein FliH [Oxalobacteraceae bacterium R-40]